MTRKGITNKKGKGLHKIGAALIAMLLVVTLISGVMSTQALAAVSDGQTADRYTESLGDNASTEYAGRIWTDKSVYSDDATFNVYGGGNTTIEKAEDEDFLLAFSALGTSQSVSGQQQAPVDVVFVIDMSGSMRDNKMDNRKTRLANTIAALNASIEKILSMGEHTRIGVVAFSGEAKVLLELDHYSKLKNNAFFSTDTSENEIYTRAVGAQKGTIDTTTETTRGTNIQRGIFDGMNMLASETDTTVTIDGKTVTRVPSVILLSDGAPTIGSDFESWWNLSGDTKDYSYDSVRPLYGMQAIMTASYMKKAVDRNYKVAGTANATKVYSIGMGINNITGEDKNLAFVTIDPATHIDKDNDSSEAIRNAWNTYKGNNNTGTPRLKGDDNSYYTFKHPDTGYDIDSIDYVDQYYDADNAQAVVDVFDSIVSNITISTPEVPTELKGDNPITDGYITYTDPLGEYMSVKDVKAIIYAGQTFTQKTVSDDKSTYTFTGEVHSAVYGEQDVSHILITVEKDADGNETLTIKVPASVIPVRVNTVILNKDGTVKSHTNNGTYPVRVVYSVALRDGLTSMIDGQRVLDTTQLSEEYIAANTNEKGEINFYSNLYTGEIEVNEHTAGNATVEFEPSHSNPFYYMQEDIAIYEDEDCTKQVSASEGMQNGTTYYYQMKYYHGTDVEVETVARTGAQLKRTSIVEIDGNLYRAEGSPRLNRILEFEGTKDVNSTETAKDFYAPTFQYAEGSSDPYAGKYVIYLGNNGVLSLAATGQLEVTKDVVIPEGLDPDVTEFEFTVDFNGNATLAGEYPYDLIDANGNKNSATISDGGKVTLADDEKVVIYNLPAGTTYEVTEKETAGYTVEANGATGTIIASQTVQAEFTNTYSVKSVVVPASEGFRGQKVLEGRDWLSIDTYTFRLVGYNNAPMPAVTEVTVTNAAEASFEFGSIEYTKPGTYQYVIEEKDPATEADYIPGISYSQALYEIVVTVTDDGAGKLVAEAEMRQMIDDAGVNTIVPLTNEDDAEKLAVFINKYNAESVEWGPIATKVYNDLSGNYPLTDGMFTFEITAITDGAPMPANGVHTATNIGTEVYFESIEFKTADVGKTYEYKLTEVNDGKVGMTYDESEQIVTVYVTSEVIDEKETVKVSAVYSNGKSRAEFTNTYDPQDTEVTIKGFKKLTGKDIAANEFEFELKNEAGNVLQTAKVTGGENVREEAFTFAETLKYDKPGTYNYTINEKDTGINGIVYDQTIWALRVEVEDVDGVLTATVYYNNVEDSENGKGAEFSNSYSAVFNDDEAISLIGKKELTGRDLISGEFFFVVEPKNNAPAGAKSTLVSATSDGVIQLLTDVVFTEVGTYEYWFYEQIPSAAVDNVLHGVTYDTTIYQYIVEVVDNNKGSLVVQSETLRKGGEDEFGDIVFEDTITEEELVFKNEYNVTPVVKATPELKKVIRGINNSVIAIGTYEFEFQMTVDSVEQLDGTKVNEADYAEYIQLPAKTTVKNSGNNITFGDVTFYEEGIYSLSVKELVPTTPLAGIEYSTNSIHAVFKVTDDGEGNLDAILLEFTGGDTFVNEYHAEGELQLEIAKEFVGRENNEWLDTDTFDFEVVILDPATQAAVDAGEVVFPTDGDGIQNITLTKDKRSAVSPVIKFYKDGEYKFVVREIAGNIPGVNYDSEPRVIVVTADDNGAGSINVTWIEESGKSLTFHNTYDAKTTEISGHDHLSIKKNFTGRVNDEWFDTDKFTFTLAAADDITKAAVANGNVVLPSTTLEVTNANKAHPHFGNIIFKEGGTYKFVVTELLSGIQGVTDDADNVREIIVEVVDDQQGNLVATKSSESDSLVFNNKYNRTDVTVEGATNLKIKKVLTGREWLDSDVFKFVLETVDEVTAEAVRDGKIVLPSNSIGIELTKAEQEKAFGDIVFKEVGTYKFKISEVAGTIPGVSYSHLVEVITVVVTDNTVGALVAEVSGSEDMTFENVYSSESVTTSLQGKKYYEGGNLVSGDFFFVVEAKGDAPERSGSSTVPVASDGTIQLLPNVTFTEAGTYVYWIYEQIPSAAVNNVLNGITYDATIYQYTVVVADDNAGSLYIASETLQKGLKDTTGNVMFGEVLTGDANRVVFNNTYSFDSTAYATPVMYKKIEGFNGAEVAINGYEFEFEMTVEKATKLDGTVIDAADYADYIVLPTPSTVKNNQNEIRFGEITFHEEGIYTVVVKEVAPENPVNGMTYSVQELKTVYRVVDDRNGNLSVVVEEQANTDTFVNKYEAEGTLQLTINKEFTGRPNNEWIDTDKFDFEVVILDPATKAAVDAGEVVFPVGEDGIQKITLTKDKQSKTSPAITFHKAGNYKFVVREITGNIPGVHYDAEPRVIVVEAVDNGAGSIDVIWIEESGKSLTFKNVYDPGTTELSGHDHLVITKEFTGRENDEWLDTDKFTFTLEAADDATKEAVANGTVILPNTTLEVTNANKAYPHFGNIIFEAQGTYRFVVTELPSGINGVTDDVDSTREIVVVVVDDGRGNLTATKTSDSEFLTFKNTYDTTEVTLDGETNLKVMKALVGRDWFDSDVFEFKLVAADEVTEAAIKAGNVVLPSNATGINITKSEQEKAFGDILFKEVGTYQFKITEVQGNIENIAYDAHEVIVTVVVTDNKEGSLVTAAPTYSGSMTFENTYTPGAVNVVLQGKKTLIGRPLEDGEFRFHIEIAEGSAENTPLPAVKTVRNKEDGSIVFASMNFSEVGIYKYNIVEAGGEIPGVTYDSAVVQATVEVTYDETTGKLNANVSYTKEGTDLGFEFVNVYTATSTAPITINANKTVVETAGEFVMAGGEFQFEVEPSTGNPAADPIQRATKANDANGIVEIFNNAVYTQAGTYIYTVHELAGEISGIHYDSAVYTIEVTVTDLDATGNYTGQLTASVEILKAKEGAEQTVQSIEFVNGYDPKEATVVIHGHKNLNGGHKNLEAGEFTFKLSAVTEGAPMPTETTVKNKETGLFQFELITYEQEGTYVYEVSEVNEGKAGYSYSSAVYQVTVTVTHDQDTGALHAHVEGIRDVNENPIIVFENTYVPSATSIALDGKKNIAGRELVDGEFTFILRDREGNIIDEAVNNAEGGFTFDSISYTKAGEYFYTVTEKNTGKGGVSYDESIYAVKVVVSDEGHAGQLKVTETVIYKNDTVVDTIEFNNTYKANNPAKASFSAAKVLNGRQLNDGEFNFSIEALDYVVDGVVVTKAADTPLPTEKVTVNMANGIVNFGEITFENAGTYVYQISEVKGTDEHITYDTAVHQVVVTVTDDWNGTLTATVSQIEEMIFNNTYTPDPIGVVFAGTKLLTGRDLRAEEFAFILMDSEGNVLDEVWNTEDGTFTFEAIRFEKAGSYNFIIEEKNTEVNGVTYDTGICRVHVEVTDNGKGTLTPIVTYGKDAELADTVIFTNVYKAASTSTQISAIKKLSGRELKAGEFRFVLEDEQGNKLYTANAADGRIVFDEITYTEAGTYVYKLYEEQGNLANVRYDDKVYTVTVVVEDNLNGSLVVTSQFDEAQFVFNNQYKHPDVVQTGDGTTILPLVTMLVLSIGYIVVAFTKARKR